MQPNGGIETRFWRKNGKNADDPHPLLRLVRTKVQLDGKAPKDGSADAIRVHAPQFGQWTKVESQQPLRNSCDGFIKREHRCPPQ
jgi:hypothetical protein